MTNNNSDTSEESIEQRFEKMYPTYDYSLESSHSEKDSRKRKKMKTIFQRFFIPDT